MGDSGASSEIELVGSKNKERRRSATARFRESCFNAVVCRQEVCTNQKLHLC